MSRPTCRIPAQARCRYDWHDRHPDKRRARKQSGGTFFPDDWPDHEGPVRQGAQAVRASEAPPVWAQWRKPHIGIHEQTLEIRAAEFTTTDVGDAPMMPELLDQIPPGQKIASVTRRCPQHPQGPWAPSPTAVPPRSCRPARMPNPARQTHPVRSRVTRFCAHRSPSVEPSGDDGADITAEAETRRACVASSFRAGAPPRASSTVRSPGSGSASSAIVARNNGAPWLVPLRPHRPRHPRHRSCGISRSGERRASTIRRFAQQSRPPKPRPGRMDCPTALGSASPMMGFGRPCRHTPMAKATVLRVRNNAL